MVRRRARTAKEALTTVVTSNCSDVDGVRVGGGIQHALMMNGSGSNNDGVAAGIAGANLLEDQYFASPKRKDCKLANANENLKMANIVVAAVAIEQQQQQQHRYKYSHNHHDQQHHYISNNNSSNNNNNNYIKIITQTNNAAVASAAAGGGKGKSERGGISGRNIGIPLATRSQTRTIENFFKANAAAKNSKIMTFNNESNEEEEKTISSSSSPLLSPTPIQQLMMTNKSPTPESVATDDIIDDGDDDDEDEDEDDLLPMHYIHDDDREPTPSPPRFVLNGEDTNDTIYSVPESNNHQATTNGYATLADFQTHRSTLRDSHSSHSSTATSDNIFLQEPVLKLDIDKSLNQASSIIINKSFEVGAVFSSPPSSGSLIASCMLNGRFNQIVTLNGNNSPIKRASFGYECCPITPALIDANAGAAASSLSSLNGFVNVDQDSSSCDSGVAFSANSLTPNGGSNNNSQTASLSSPLITTSRRRKPTTPHRILCPSPIKTMPREHHVLTGLVPCARKVAVALNDPLSPRKSQRQLMNGGGSMKTRRRLNKTTNKEVGAPYPRNIVADAEAVTKQKIKIKIIGRKDDEIVMISDDDADADDDDYDEDVDDDGSEHVIDGDEEFENLTNMPPAALRHDLQATSNGGGGGIAGCGALNTKSILNSAKHPTAQQNTTNNNSNINQINKMTANAINSLTTSNAIITTKPTTKKSNKSGGGGGTKPKTTTKTNKNLNNANGTTKISSKTQQQHQQQSLTTLSNGNRELTEFFPVRRSVRKTKTVVKEEMMRNLEQAVLEERAEGLKIQYFEKKGRGVIADRHFQRNEFVIEYVGDLISIQEAAEREKRYALDENAGCYMYYFKHKTQQYCIDATVDTGKLGRLVNHSRNGNLVTKVVVVKQRPHLVLLAKDDIEKGEELTYDYGDRSKESLLHHPWLAF